MRDSLFAGYLDHDMQKALKNQTRPSSSSQGFQMDSRGEATDSRRTSGQSGHVRVTSNLTRSTPYPLINADTQLSSHRHWISRRRHPWTRVHSYFALMGGFALDTSEMSINIFDENQTRGTLCVSVLLMIAQTMPKFIPDISQREIRDKSKANALAKFLVCVQAIWFCAQMVGRLATDDNPISLLELNTFLHAICCLATYGAWWHKPLDIHEPELIDASKQKNHRFYARLCLGRKLHYRSLVTKPEFEGSFTAILERGPPPDGPRNPQAFRENYTFAFRSKDVTQDVKRAIQELDEDRQHITLRLYDQQACFGYYLKISQKPAVNTVYADLKWADIECLRLADELICAGEPAVQEHPQDALKAEWDSKEQLKAFVEHASMVKTPGGLTRLTPPMSVTNSKFLGGLFSGFKTLDLVLWFCLFAASAIYGGVHLFAWNGPFHTSREQWMWRISSIIVACPILFFPCLLIVVHVIAITTGDEGSRGETVGKVAMFVTLLTFVLAHSAARVILLVECFINLSHLPPEVYKEPAWSRYIPHFSAG